jgi:hypothetical protein
VRTWTGRGGSSVEAAFVGVKTGNVILKSAEGKLMQIPFKRLSDADQAYLTNELKVNPRSLAGDAEPGVIPPRTESRLPVLADSRWARPDEPRQGHVPEDPIIESFAHTVYEGTTYTAYVGDEADLSIMPKPESGGSEYAFNGPIRMRCWQSYYDEGKRESVARKIVRFIQPPAPSRNPARLKLKALLDDSVVWDLELEFAEKSITIETDVADPPKLEPVTQLTLGFRVPRSHLFPDELDLAGMRNAVRDCSLEVRGEARSETYDNYIRSMTLRGSFVESVIKNHWHGRTVTFEVVKRSGRKEQARMSNYKGSNLSTGYNINSYNNAWQIYREQAHKPIGTAVIKISIE